MNVLEHALTIKELLEKEKEVVKPFTHVKVEDYLKMLQLAVDLANALEINELKWQIYNLPPTEIN